MYHRLRECASGCEVIFDWDALPPLFPEFEDPKRWLPLLQQHAGILSAAAEHTRVTAVGPADAVRRHYAESLELLRIIELSAPSLSAAGSVADVGSGGGFPGLVFAAVRPNLTVHLIEPLQKRARLLSQAATELRLANVHVHPRRAEDAGRGALRDSVDAVTARAVAELRELLEYTAPLAKPGGMLAFPKGSAFEGELAAAGSALSDLGCGYLGAQAMRPAVSENLSVATFKKLASTPERYPRRAGLPSKRPL